MSRSSALEQTFRAWLSDNPDEVVLRWIFRGIVAVTMTALIADLAGIQGWVARPGLVTTPAEIQPDSPSLDLPNLVPAILAPLLPGGDKRATPLPRPDGALAQPMTFDLTNGGKLLATGTITPGVSDRFAAEIGRHGEYIKTVLLNSPGGSVADALAMGRLIRERKFSTEVAAGKYCASSCPLVFAGGVERHADSTATIGVHQVSAIGPGAVRDEMSMAQAISARCERYLADMGIDLQVWVHAMETSHDKLFVFKLDELKALNLTTPANLATSHR